MGTLLHPTAGFIADVSSGAAPGPLAPRERGILRSLALQLRDAASHPRHAERRAAWISHGNLASKQPMLLVFPEDSWIEIIREEDLGIADPFWRQWEWYLKMLAWRAQNLVDDFVIEPELPVALVTTRGSWGVDVRYTRGGPKGSYVWDAPLRTEADMDRLRYADLRPDRGATDAAADAVSDAVGGVLPVKVMCPVPGVNLIGEATMLRGLEQCLLDMYDAPAFLHRLMDFLGRGFLADVERLEQGGFLTLNNGGQYTDSGGVGYTTDLPAPGSGPGVRLRDLWILGVAQELSGVGPAQHEEFVLEHQRPILERFGLVAYGCCEPYTHKFEMLKRRVPRLRRVSVSPWCDLDTAVKALEDRYIFSWKPTPAMLADAFHPEDVRAYLRDMLTRTRGCVVEIILKDTFTIQRDPARVIAWARIAREEIERAAG